MRVYQMVFIAIGHPTMESRNVMAKNMIVGLRNIRPITILLLGYTSYMAVWIIFCSRGVIVMVAIGMIK